MARVTVEDCVDKVDNRFELVLLAAHRARALSAGAALQVDRDNDKNPVVALREVADSKVEVDELMEDYITSMQRQLDTDEPEIDPADGGASGGSDAPDMDTLTEEELLKALQFESPERT